MASAGGAEPAGRRVWAVPGDHRSGRAERAEPVPALSGAAFSPPARETHVSDILTLADKNVHSANWDVDIQGACPARVVVQPVCALRWAMELGG